MEVFQAIILGIVQGITEFLPISSSGHLIIIPSAFGWEEFTNNLTFDVALHVGTALAVVIFFWGDWIRILKSFLKNAPSPKRILADYDSKFLIMIAVGSIPAAIVGLLFEDVIEEKIREPQIVIATLFLFALILWLAEKVGSKKREITSLSFKDAVFVGIAQAISLIPGVSRSGVTISAGLFSGMSRESAARFSFLLSTPAIVGAGILRIKDLFEGGTVDLSLLTIVVGVVTSALVGWLAIKYLLKYVLTHDYNIFVWYRIAIALVALLIFL
jgi:undecaprenyl-diphosphatase